MTGKFYPLACYCAHFHWSDGERRSGIGFHEWQEPSFSLFPELCRITMKIYPHSRSQIRGEQGPGPSHNFTTSFVCNLWNKCCFSMVNNYFSTRGWQQGDSGLLLKSDTTALSLSTSQGQTVCYASIIILLSRSPVSHYSWQRAETEVVPLKAFSVHQPSDGTHIPHSKSSFCLPNIPLCHHSV